MIGPYRGMQPIDVREMPYVSGFDGGYIHMVYPTCKTVGDFAFEAQREADRWEKHFSRSMVPWRVPAP